MRITQIVREGQCRFTAEWLTALGVGGRQCRRTASRGLIGRTRDAGPALLRFHARNRFGSSGLSSDRICAALTNTRFRFGDGKKRLAQTSPAQPTRLQAGVDWKRRGAQVLKLWLVAEFRAERADKKRAWEVLKNSLKNGIGSSGRTRTYDPLVNWSAHFGDLERRQAFALYQERNRLASESW
jgi:hypothetical protein